MGARAVSTADPYLLGVGRLTYSNIPITSVSLLPVDRPVAVIGGVNTTLTNAPLAGTNTIQVADATDIEVGQTLALGLGTGYEEVVTVASINGTTITLQSDLYYSHKVGVTVKQITPDGSDLLLTDYRNLIFGIQRDIKWETERHARRRSTSFVMTLRVDTQVENPDALVLLEGLTSK